MMQKKKINGFILGILTCLTIMGCSFEQDSLENVKTKITPLEEGENQESTGNLLQSGQEGSTEGIEEEAVQGQIPEGQVTESADARINDQSFDVTLRPLGQVTFASYKPDTSDHPLADVVFQIERGGEVICRLPGTSEDNTASEMFAQVEAVSFMDYNKDNYDDIIIIISYYFGAGPQAAQSHPVVRYYNGTAEGNFIYQKEMSQEATSALAEITVQTAKDFIGAGENTGSDLELWQQAYIEYLTNDSVVESNRGYTLILLNDDEIPELVEVGTDEATGCRIVSYADGTVHVNQTNRLYFSYIPGENLLCNSEGHMDYYYDLVYRLSDGEFDLIASGYYGAMDNSRVEFDEEGNPVYQFEWNGVRMSEEEYQKELSGIYDVTKAVTYDYDNLYSADEVKKIIEDDSF